MCVYVCVCGSHQPSMYADSTHLAVKATQTHTDLEPSVTTPGQAPGQVEEPKGRSYIKRCGGLQNKEYIHQRIVHERKC